MLIVVRAKENGDILSQGMVNSQIGAILGTEEDRSIHNKLQWLRRASDPSRNRELLIYIQGRNEAVLLRIRVVGLIHEAEVRISILVAIKAIDKLRNELDQLVIHFLALSRYATNYEDPRDYSYVFRL